MDELLEPHEMARADALAAEGSMAIGDLMERAGEAVARIALDRFAPGERVTVLCGPGNNGGDGLVAARHLARAGRSVRVLLHGDSARLRGASAAALDAWRQAGGIVDAAVPERIGGPVIDALFGAGLDRPVTGEAAALIEAVNAAGGPVLAVDLPSGVEGGSGLARGAAVQADHTVTFFRLKPGHLLLPGRDLCGSLHLRQIGIPASVLAVIGPRLLRNGPAAWGGAWQPPGAGGHKYTRGHALVVSGGSTRTGAARLSAEAALAAGAGLVTLASPPDALLVNAGHLTAVMLARMSGPADLSALLGDARIGAVALGPGLGIGGAAGRTRALVETALAGGRPVVLDADALTAFEDDPDRLLGLTAGAQAVLTPHGGEFARLFGAPGDGIGRLAAARAAAARAGAVVVLKGSDTVVAEPGGRAVVNDNAPPWLATAGSGDVLTGLIAGLLATGLAPFEAACLGVWLHGEAGRQAGPGLTAADLSTALRPGLARLAARLS